MYLSPSRAFIRIARELLASKSGVYFIKHHVVQNLVIQKYMANSVDVEGVRAVIIEYFNNVGLDSEVHVCVCVCVCACARTHTSTPTHTHTQRAALELTYQYKESGRKPEILVRHFRQRIHLHTYMCVCVCARALARARV